MVNRIREIREEMGKSQEWLGKQLGIGKAMVSKLEKGQAKLTQGYMEKIATALKLDDQFLLLKTRAKESGNQKNSNISHPITATQTGSRHFPLNVDDLVPMYGAVSASSPEVVHFTEEYMIEEVPRHPSVQKVKGAFAMQVAGDSMAPRHFPGERVYINPHQIPHIGQDCVVVYEPEGNAILKQFRGETPTEWKFSQLNPVNEFAIEKSRVRKIYAVVR